MGGESLGLHYQELSKLIGDVEPDLQKEWKKRIGSQNGGEQESISHDGDSSDFGPVLPKPVSISSVPIASLQS